MLPLVSTEQMRKLDELATREYAVPSLLLMENAGRSVVEEIESHWGSLRGKSLLIAAGKGNNGGDGFVAARHALQRQAFVTLLLVAKEAELLGDAKTNYQILIAAAHERLTIVRSFRPNALSRDTFDFIVDAIFGTSFHGEVKGKFKDVIRWINGRHKSKIVAVDVPSGLDATTGDCSTTVVRADLTVTMALPKIGLYVGKGREVSGSISIADIHIPATLSGRISSEIFLIEARDVSENLPQRAIDAHKHSVGKIFVLAGSKGLTGAALLCSQSAMKSGAGAVVLGIPEAVFSAVARRTLEVMPFALPSTPEGSIASSAMNAINQKMAWADVLLLGPGLSQNSETQDLIRRIISTSTKTIVIDADGLNALAGDCSILVRRRNREIILTPHVGEFSRLARIASKEIEKNKIEIARTFARDNNVVLVLKGAPTVVAEPKGRVFVNPTGNPGMATAGSGDVLSGIIAALVGQGNGIVDAAINAVYIHGLAGDMAREQLGELGMVASDILKKIPFALKQTQKGNNLVGD